MPAQANAVAQVFKRREIAFQGRIVGGVGKACMVIRPGLENGQSAPRHRALLRSQEPAQHPQQGGLAGAVRPRHVQQLVRAQVEAHALEHVAIAAPDMDLFNTETVGRAIHAAAILAKSKSWRYQLTYERE